LQSLAKLCLLLLVHGRCYHCMALLNCGNIKWLIIALENIIKVECAVCGKYPGSQNFVLLHFVSVLNTETVESISANTHSIVAHYILH